MWDSRITISIGIQQSLQKIFAALIIKGLNVNIPDELELYKRKLEVFNICRARFISEFPFNVFNNSYAIFYEIIVTLQVTDFTTDQLTAVIDTNRDLILDSPNIDISEYKQTMDGNMASDDDIVMAVTSQAIDEYNMLTRLYITEEEFKSACMIYKDWYKNTLAQYTAQNMSAIMEDTGQQIKKPGKRSRVYHGLNDMIKYYNENMRIINALSEENRIKSVVLDEQWYESEMQRDKVKDTAALFPIGLRQIDEKLGNLRRGHMIGILGPPKGGKTRFSNFLVQKALSLGLNVCVWPLEGSIDEWQAMQIACYLARTSYESGRSRNQNDMTVYNSKDILERKYMSSKTMREQIAAAKLTMATSPKYGRLSFIKGTGYVEDFIEVLQSHYDNENPYDVLVIDSLVNMLSHNGMNKVQCISEAYMLTKDFIENKLTIPALGIMPAQLKQSVVDFLRRNPDETIDVTGGAESAETIRTPDEIIGLFSSKEERENDIMRIYSVGSRHGSTFQDFQAKCKLGACYFMNQDDE